MSPKWDMENVKKSIGAKNNFRVGVFSLCKQESTLYTANHTLSGVEVMGLIGLKMGFHLVK